MVKITQPRKASKNKLCCSCGSTGHIVELCKDLLPTSHITGLCTEVLDQILQKCSLDLMLIHW